MPNGKRRNQDQYLSPVFYHINCRQCKNKQLVIQCITTYDMLPAKPEIKRKIAHN